MNDIVGRRQLRIRLVPWTLLLMAVPFLLIAAVAWHEGTLHGSAWLVLVVPLVIGSFFEVTTLSVDQDTRQLTVRRARPWGASERAFSFEDLVAVAVEESSGSRSRTYRVAFALRSGEKLPLQGFTSSGRASKQRLAQRLADAVSLGRSAPVVAALDGVLREASSGTTDGLDWTLEQVDRGNDWELTSFRVSAARLADGFVLVTPASARATTPPLGGVLGGLMRAIVQQYLRALELTEADLPRLNETVVLEHDALSRAGFVASTSSPEAARRWLDAGAAALLAEWQQRPLLLPGRTSTKTRGASPEPRVVLGPGGLRLLFRVSLREPSALSRVRELGLALAHTSVLA